MHTKQFTVGDVGFWKGSFQLPHNSPLHLLLQDNYSTLKNESEVRSHGPNHPPRFLCLRPLPLKGLHMFDTSHYKKRRRSRIISLWIHTDIKIPLCHTHSNIYYHCHMVLCHHPKTTSRRNQLIPGWRSLSMTRRSHVPEAPRLEQHHHCENGTVF